MKHEQYANATEEDKEIIIRELREAIDNMEGILEPHQIDFMQRMQPAVDELLQAEVGLVIQFCPKRTLCVFSSAYTGGSW